MLAQNLVSVTRRKLHGSPGHASNLQDNSQYTENAGDQQKALRRRHTAVAADFLRPSAVKCTTFCGTKCTQPLCT